MDNSSGPPALNRGRVFNTLFGVFACVVTFSIVFNFSAEILFPTLLNIIPLPFCAYAWVWCFYYTWLFIPHRKNLQKWWHVGVCLFLVYVGMICVMKCIHRIIPPVWIFTPHRYINNLLYRLVLQVVAKSVDCERLLLPLVEEMDLYERNTLVWRLGVAWCVLSVMIGGSVIISSKWLPLPRGSYLVAAIHVDAVVDMMIRYMADLRLSRVPYRPCLTTSETAFPADPPNQDGREQDGPKKDDHNQRGPKKDDRNQGGSAASTSRLVFPRVRMADVRSFMAEASRRARNVAPVFGAMSASGLVVVTAKTAPPPKPTCAAADVTGLPAYVTVANDAQVEDAMECDSGSVSELESIGNQVGAKRSRNSMDDTGSSKRRRLNVNHTTGEILH